MTLEDEQDKKHYLSKPCIFCPNMAEYSPLEELEAHGVGVYFCHPCQAEYLFYQSGAPASTSLYTTINDKMYRWTITADKTAVLWYVSLPGVPGKRVNKDLTQLKSFNDKPIPDITPSNIENKIRTWLPFL